MNLEFLQKYAALHLQDIGEYSEEAYEKYVSECSDFLTTIKDADHELWEDVMTMSPSKQSLLMKTLLEDHSQTIMPGSNEIGLQEFEEFIGFKLSDPVTDEMKLEVCEEFGMTMDELEALDNIEEDSGVINAAGKAIGYAGSKIADLATGTVNVGNDIVDKLPGAIASGFNGTDGNPTTVSDIADTLGMSNWTYTGIAAVATLAAAAVVFKLLKKQIKMSGDLWGDIGMSDAKTQKLSAYLQYFRFVIGLLGFGVAYSAGGWLFMLFWTLWLVMTIRSMTAGANVVIDTIGHARHLFYGIFKFIKSHNSSITFSKRYHAMYSLERSQLQGCIKSCDVGAGGDLEKLHIIRLALTNVGHRDNNPTAVDAKRYIKADCLFSCCMRYMVAMVAELYGALKACIKNTMGVDFKIRGDAIIEVQSLKLNASCEPIRTELNDIITQFNSFLELTYKGHSQELTRWRQALNNQIMMVMNGQHSRPVSVKYGTNTTTSPIVFEF